MVALTRNAGPKLLNEQQGGRFDHRAQCMHARCGIGAVDNAASHVDDRFIIRPGTTAPRLLPLQTSRRAGQALRDGSFQSTPVTRPESCDWQQWVGSTSSQAEVVDVQPLRCGRLGFRPQRWGPRSGFWVPLSSPA